MQTSLGSSRSYEVYVNTLGPSWLWRKRLLRQFGKTFGYDVSSEAGSYVMINCVLCIPAMVISMNALFVSTGVVALAEMGDKTQLLAFLLAARFKKPVPIILGILIATLLNHGLAGALGSWITQNIDAETLRWILGISFIAMAIWTLIPDKIEEDDAKLIQKFGVFGASLVTFFIAEMGDKTQIATIAMAARFDDMLLVVLGTTLGMMIANVPAVYLGEKFANRIPMRLVHSVAALIFFILGIFTLLKADQWL